MVSPLVRRLEAYAELSQEDRAALDRLGRGSVHERSPRRDLVREGDNPRVVRLILAGWACRYKGTSDGRRQVVGFFIPGDFCDLDVYVLREMDHSVGALTPLRFAEIRPGEIEAVAAAHPQVTQAFWRHELVDSAIRREGLLNIGRRSAYERIAHLLTGLFFRSRSAGLVEGDSCPFPLTQADMADATGLTPVHVNRTLQELRRGTLVEVDRRRPRIPDLGRMMKAARFNPNYLHLEQAKRAPLAP